MSIHIGFIGIQTQLSPLPVEWMQALSPRTVALGTVQDSELPYRLPEDRALLYELPRHKVVLNQPLALQLIVDATSPQLSPQEARLFHPEICTEALVFYLHSSTSSFGHLVIRSGRKEAVMSNVMGYAQVQGEAVELPDWYLLPPAIPDWAFYCELANRFLGQSLESTLESMEAAQLLAV